MSARFSTRQCCREIAGGHEILPYGYPVTSEWVPAEREGHETLPYDDVGVYRKRERMSVKNSVTAGYMAVPL